MKGQIKLILSCLLLVLVAAVIQSCGDDDDSKPKPTASFTASKTTAGVGEAITFTNTSEDATSYLWSFGDGTTSTEESPVKSYAATGEYEVTLAAKGSGGTATTSQDITISAGAEVFVADYGTELIQKFAVASPATLSTVKDVAGMSGVGIAYDATHQKIYFSDFTAFDEGKIWVMNMDGSGLDDIITGLYEPWGIALDVEGGKIYYTDGADLDDEDNDTSHIYRANLDGSGVETIVTMEGALFRTVALDLVHDKLYFYDVELENLYIANLNGTGQDIIVEGAYGYAIAVDETNSKLYFDDQNSNEGDGALMMSALDGTGIVTVDNTASRIYGISIDNATNKLYWSARDNGAVYQSALNGTGRVTLNETFTSPRGMFLKK